MKPETGNIGDTSVTYPYSMGYLPPAFVKKAEEEILETPEKAKQGIKELRQLIREEDGISNEWYSDDEILMYLRGKKFRTNDSLSSIKKTVTLIKKYPEYFQPFDPEIKDQLEHEGVIKVLPVRNQDGCVMIHVTLGNWNLSKTSFDNQMKYAMMILLQIMNDPMTQVNGVVLLYDYQQHVLRYAKYFTPYYVYLVHQLVMECLPLRLKSIHVLNPSMLAKIGMSLVYPVCTEKFKKRLVVHNNLSSVFDDLQSNIIPKKYGGELEEDKDFDKFFSKTLSMPDYVIAILDSLKS